MLGTFRDEPACALHCSVLRTVSHLQLEGKVDEADADCLIHLVFELSVLRCASL